MILVEDNFLSDFEGFRIHCDSLSYDGMTNPLDGVFYPGVTTDIPEPIKAEIIGNLSDVLGFTPSVSAMFLRITTEGTPCPHEVHTDALMGSLALMLYMNRKEHCLGGTSFVIHKETGLQRNPINHVQSAVWERDHNIRDAWEVLSSVDMIPNRALLFDAAMMHRALPVGGFGSSPADGRLVLTAFIS